MRRVQVVPCTIKEANRLVKRLHRHHQPVHGALFAIGAVIGDDPTAPLNGVAIVGRPVSATRDDGWTAEVVRLCSDGSPNICSALYGACARAAFGMGYRRIGTYIYESEPGTTLKASGWVNRGKAGGSWARHKGRVTTHDAIAKRLWETTKNYDSELPRRQRVPEHEQLESQEVLAL